MRQSGSDTVIGLITGPAATGNTVLSTSATTTATRGRIRGARRPAEMMSFGDLTLDVR